ncbi:MAG: hypothetical protein ABSH14_07670, partial [Verrucomicrobiia bacterium]
MECVQETAARALQEHPGLHAELLTGALQWATQHAHVSPQTELTLGPAAIHAAIIANNLISLANPARSDCPGVKPKDLDGATTPSLEALEELLRGGYATSEESEASMEKLAQRLDASRTAPAVTAGDLIAIHLLNDGLARACGYVAAYQEPPQRTGVQRDQVKGAAIGVVALACLVIGGVAKQPLLLLGGLTILAVALAIWRGQKVMIQSESPAWVRQLRAAAAESEHQELRDQFRRCDLLAGAAQGLAGTTAEDPSIGAHLLQQVHARPGGALALKPLAHQLRLAANEANVLRLARLGEELVAEDRDGRGAELASLLLIELLLIYPAPNEDSPLWSLLAKEEPNGSSVPRFFVALLRRAAALRRARRCWRAREVLVADRCAAAARELLGRSPLANPHWHLFVVRCVRHLLEPGAAAVRLPAGSGCSLESLCERVEEIHAVYRKGAVEKSAETILEESWNVMQMEGFLGAVAPVVLAGERRVVSERYRSGRVLDDYLNWWLQRGDGDEPPTPGSCEHDNLERWRASGEPQRWAEGHNFTWSHDDWLSLLKQLEESVYWPMKPYEVGALLEELKRKPPPALTGRSAYLA